MNKSKVAVVSSQIWQKVESILGWIISAFFFLILVVDLTDTSDEAFSLVLVISLLFLALGVFMIIKGKQRKKIICAFKDYVQILAGDPLNSLDTIAEKTGTSVDVVKQNISVMINKNYFANAKIDEYSNTLILNGKADTQQVLSEKASQSVPVSSPIATQKVQPAAALELLSIKCKGCGAINIVPRGLVAECEYCGNMIKGE